MTAVSSIPICFINPEDSFKRLRIIGEGGSKIVWLVNELFSQTLKALAQFRLPSDLEQEEFIDERTSQEGIEKERKEALCQAINESQLINRLAGSPQIVSVEKVVYDGVHPYLLMPYYSGGDLEQAIQKNSLETEQKLQIAIDLLQGLQTCQAVGIFIGDIKPSNVLINEELHAFITDFGTSMPTEDVFQLGVDTYNLFSNVFSRLFVEKDGQPYNFVNQFLSDYSPDSGILSKDALKIFC